MINFPVFHHLDIANYGLYPGKPGSDSGLKIDFLPGLTLVLGTNGLGKTTLVTILYRLLSGPFDISGFANNAELGSTKLTPTQISQSARKTFANRVVDGARNAYARLSFQLGENKIIVERQLDDLSLKKFIVNEQLLTMSAETIYHEKITTMSGVSSFGDWILLLRYLVFYFEDRRTLVWDPSAQRQILRLLLLPIETASKWTKDERDILELDSRMRNINVVLSREERALAQNEARQKSSTDIRKTVADLEEQRASDQEMLERLEKDLTDVDKLREQTRLRVLTNQQTYEAKFRSIEQAKLKAISSEFPSLSETAQYILAQLLSTEDCLVCGNHVPDAATFYSSRISHKQCVICGSDLKSASHSILQDNDHYDNITQTTTELPLLEKELNEALQSLADAESAYTEYETQISALRRKITKQARQIEILIRQLPPEEARVHQQRSHLSVLRNVVEEQRATLTLKRENFKRFVEEINRYIVKWREDIKAAFDNFAEGFLLETCQLKWEPQKARVGQGGETVYITFPAFELEMSGADFAGTTRRGGPDQVSESQREFIDLAFRMALMSVASNTSSGTMVMDAPESSLDAVFSIRASRVLSRFANTTSNNRLLVTSNLVEGQLIPDLIKGSIPFSQRDSRLINLIEIAVPTAAVRKLKSDYEEVWQKLFENTLS